MLLKSSIKAAPAVCAAWLIKIGDKEHKKHRIQKA